MADGGHSVELVKKLGTLVDEVKSFKDDIAEQIQTRDDKVADLEDELKRYGAEFGDTKAKLADVQKSLADKLGNLSTALDAIDAIKAQLDKPGASGSEGDKVDADRKSAIDFFEIKHYEKFANSANTNVPEFDGNTVTPDMVAELVTARKAFNKMLKAKASVQNPATLLNPDELKAISTITHGNEFWLQTEMSDRLIACWEDETDLSAMFDSMTISRQQVSMLVDHDEDPEDASAWNCEANCNPGPNVSPEALGVRTYMTGLLRAEQCVTHEMIEDAEIDIPSWLTDKVGRRFQKLRNRAFMKADGVNKPHGILRPGNHVTINSGTVSGTPAGEFVWQDLVQMYIRLNNRFKANSSWWMHEDALAHMMTMTDGEGRPIFSAQSILGNSYPALMGRPVRENTHMPNYLDGAGDKILGSKPVALGDWKAGYIVINRRGFTVLRDPWSLVRCGVVWHFSQRLGGGVLCPEAMMFLNIV